MKVNMGPIVYAVTEYINSGITQDFDWTKYCAAMTVEYLSMPKEMKDLYLVMHRNRAITFDQIELWKMKFRPGNPYCPTQRKQKGV